MCDVVDAVEIRLVVLIIQVLPSTIHCLERFDTGIVEGQRWAAQRERERVNHNVQE